jgi:mono/diheme cytochrome c family protein
VAWYDTATLANGSFAVRTDRQFRVSAGGPSAVILDEARNRMFVSTRFDNGFSTLALDTGAEVDHRRMRNPEPAEVRVGRKWLYDARISSSRGDSSCSGCHIFGDMDHLAWDLGNPDEVLAGSPNTYNSSVPLGLTKPTFHPMKGPMTTQSFRGMVGQGPMHWRGDRTGVTAAADETLEEQSFEDFKGAFTGLLGRGAPLNDAEMNEFSKFALTIVYPPNPHRALDNQLNADEQAGSDFYHNVTSDLIATCNGCHVLDESAGFYGTDGTMSIEGPTFDEDFKIPHLRNNYQKVGMFGSTGRPGNGAGATGPQIRGFGFSNDGSVDTLVSFLRASVFSFPNPTVREQTARFVMAFPSNLAPIMGQQLTVSAATPRSTAARARLDLLRARASVLGPQPECELVAQGVLGGRRFSALLNSAGSFTRADATGTLVGFDALYDAAEGAGNSITWTCVPPGSGLRIGIDRNLDGVPDAQL